VHFVFHGCGGSSKSFGKAGYNDLAAANNIIMVYPDVRCWDNEGDIDPEGFNTNTGILPTAIKSMIDRVTGLTSPSGTGSSCTAEEDRTGGGGGGRRPRPDDGDNSPPRPNDDDRAPRPRPPRPNDDDRAPRPRPPRPNDDDRAPRPRPPRPSRDERRRNRESSP